MKVKVELDLDIDPTAVKEFLAAFNRTRQATELDAVTFFIKDGVQYGLDKLLLGDKNWYDITKFDVTIK